MTPRAKLHRQRQVVQAVVRAEDGRTRFRNVATFAEAHLSPAGEPLPDWTPEQRAAFLDPRIQAAALTLRPACSTTA